MKKRRRKKGRMPAWKDWFLFGLAAGYWLNLHARRRQGERIGVVEKAVVALARSAGVQLDEDSNPGRQKRK